MNGKAILRLISCVFYVQPFCYFTMFFIHIFVALYLANMIVFSEENRRDVLDLYCKELVRFHFTDISRGTSITDSLKLMCRLWYMHVVLFSYFNHKFFKTHVQIVVYAGCFVQRSEGLYWLVPQNLCEADESIDFRLQKINKV